MNPLSRALSHSIRGFKGQVRTPLSRFFSTELSEREAELKDLLQKKLEATTVSVADISGGCGAMFKIEVHSPKFSGKGLLDQHRMVKDVLKDEIKDMHGLTIKTRAA